SALTRAYPIRWVKETLPPRPRLRGLLTTMRLSISSLAGTARTLVAVGTARLASMLVTVRAATPRRRTSSAPPGTWGAGAAFLAGFSGAFAAGCCPVLATGAAAGFCWGTGAVGAEGAVGAGVGGEA